MGRELSEMTLEELWELFPIILKEHNRDYKSWYEMARKTSILSSRAIVRPSRWWLGSKI